MTGSSYKSSRVGRRRGLGAPLASPTWPVALPSHPHRRVLACAAAGSVLAVVSTAAPVRDIRLLRPGARALASAAHRSAGISVVTRTVGNLGWYRSGGRSAALLIAVRPASGWGPRATRTATGVVHRRGYHRGILLDSRAFASNVADVSRLPTGNAGGSFSAAQMVFDGGVSGPWFSGSKVGCDGQR
jgi:hypothetical protein